MKRLGIVKVTPEILETALCLPSGTIIRNVFQDAEDIACNRYSLIIESKEMCEVPENGKIPEVNIEYTKKVVVCNSKIISY